MALNFNPLGQDFLLSMGEELIIDMGFVATLSP
jgi:hypothetical protein